MVQKDLESGFKSIPVNDSFLGGGEDILHSGVGDFCFLGQGSGVRSPPVSTVLDFTIDPGNINLMQDPNKKKEFTQQ